MSDIVKTKIKSMLEKIDSYRDIAVIRDGSDSSVVVMIESSRTKKIISELQAFPDLLITTEDNEENPYLTPLRIRTKQ